MNDVSPRSYDANGRVYASQFEFATQLHAASGSATSLGSRAFAKGVLSGAIPETGANCFRGALGLLGADTSEMDRADGMTLLADAFRISGQLDLVASTVRDVFARWRDRAIDADRWRAAFGERLAQYGATASIVRFNTLLDGSNAGKIFVIGANKTGTTSLQVALQQANILCGPQHQHELLFRDWANRRFDRIIELCRYYEAFQDLPFSLPFTYHAVDQAFPDARFILSIRASSEHWYESLVRYHRELLFNGEPPRWELIDQHAYCYPGLFAEAARLFWMAGIWLV